MRALKKINQKSSVNFCSALNSGCIDTKDVWPNVNVKVTQRRTYLAQSVGGGTFPSYSQPGTMSCVLVEYTQ